MEESLKALSPHFKFVEEGAVIGINPEIGMYEVPKYGTHAELYLKLDGADQSKPITSYAPYGKLHEAQAFLDSPASFIVLSNRPVVELLEFMEKDAKLTLRSAVIVSEAPLIDVRLGVSAREFMDLKIAAAKGKEEAAEFTLRVMPLKPWLKPGVPPLKR